MEPRWRFEATIRCVQTASAHMFQKADGMIQAINARLAAGQGSQVSAQR